MNTERGKKKDNGSSLFFLFFVIVLLSIPLLVLGVINHFYIHRYFIDTITQEMNADLHYKVNLFESQIERFNSLITEFKNKKMFYTYFIQENPVGFMDISDILRENTFKMTVNDIVFYNSVTGRFYSPYFAIPAGQYEPDYEQYSGIESLEADKVFLTNKSYNWINTIISRIDGTRFNALLYIVPFEQIKKEIVSSFIFRLDIDRLKSSVFISRDATDYEIYSGDVCIFSSRENFRDYQSPEEEVRRKNIFVTASGNYNLNYAAVKPKSAVYSALDSLPLVLPVSLFCILGLELIIIRILFSIVKLNRQNRALVEENVIFKVIADSVTGKPENDEKQNKRLAAAIDDYIMKNYKEANFSAKLLADKFNLSVSNLSHFYKKYHGVNISDTVTLLRMETACNYLKNSETAVQEIVRRIGYQEVSGFIKKFKGKYGMTPGEYRDKNRGLNHLDPGAGKNP